MTQPSVIVTELDGALGVLPPSAGALYALIGVSTKGALNTPATYARIKDLVADFGAGPLVEAAAHYIEKYGRPVVLVRSGQTVAGSFDNPVSGADGSTDGFAVTGAGTASPSLHTDPDPDQAMQVQIIFITGGTVGVSGIVYQYTIDGGNTFGLATPLGTSSQITIHGVQVDLGTGTILPGEIISYTTTAPILASAGSVVQSPWSGSAVPTVGANEPNDDYQAVIRFLTSGTVTSPGITYQVSLDGGRNFGPVIALGSADTIDLTGTGLTSGAPVQVALTHSTIVAGDTVSFPTFAPCWNTSDLSDSLNALAASAVLWELVHIVGPMTSAAMDLLESAIPAMLDAGKAHAWIGNTRMPNPSESESTYLASLTSVFSSKSTTFGDLCAGACRVVSSVSGRQYRRPIAFAVAAREAFVSHEIDTADVNIGTLPVSIRDANGNPDEHDESVHPGLDDARFTVLRTWEGIAGVYVNRPRLFSAEGSDFQLLPHRRVMNLAHIALRLYFIRRLNKPILVDRKTGFILEEEAQEIEKGAVRALEDVLRAKPKASDVQFVLSRTDNVLSTKTLNGSARIVPLAYPEFIELELGFLNPALQVQTV